MHPLFGFYLSDSVVDLPSLGYSKAPFYPPCGTSVFTVGALFDARGVSPTSRAG